MAIVYLAVLFLGGDMFVLFVTLLLGVADDGGPFPLKGLVFAGMGLVCAIYSIKQLLLPLPRRPHSNPDDLQR